MSRYVRSGRERPGRRDRGRDLSAHTISPRFGSCTLSQDSDRLSSRPGVSVDRVPVKHLVGSVAILLSAIAACDNGSSHRTVEPDPGQAACSGFGSWQQSEYVLPYTVGEAYRVDQGNCSGFGHSGFWQFGYDFEMPVGTVITAAREGTVVHAQDGAVDGDRSRTNLITIEHTDGSVALYSHLTLNGVQVTVGQHVLAGDVIGLSGDTGNTGGLPHLHFSLHPCRSLPGLPGTEDCASIPVNFRNTDANPEGLIANRRYEALPHRQTISSGMSPGGGIAANDGNDGST